MLRAVAAAAVPVAVPPLIFMEAVGMRVAQRSNRARLPLFLVLSACLVLLILSVTLGVAIGSVSLSPAQVWGVITAHLRGSPHESVADSIVWKIRLPRVLLAAVVGAALSTTGAVVQVLVRNSLADPYLLGVSSGASVGATAVLLFGVFSGLGLWALSAGGILGASVAMALVYLLSQRRGHVSPTQLLLCGVVLASMFASVTSFLLFKANPEGTQAVLFWLLGSFGSANWMQLPIPSLILIVTMVFLYTHARSLNALAVGEDVAASVGIDVARLRRSLFVLTCLAAGVAVSVSGVIGFVGLVVPHIVRLIVGSDHRRVLPVAALFGASFTVIGDLLARTLVAPQEMPMGVITAFIGAPTLIVLIRRRPALYGGST